MRFFFSVDLTGNLIMIDKLVLGKTWTGDLPIFNPNALYAPSEEMLEFGNLSSSSWIPRPHPI